MLITLEDKYWGLFWEMKNEELTEQIIKAFFKVYNTLGYCFLEKVNERAMMIGLKEMGFEVENQKRVLVYYKGQIVGDYSADLMVEDTDVCELKSNENLVTENEDQLVNYLKATPMETGLLLNFGKKPQIKRKVYDNNKNEWYKAKSR